MTLLALDKVERRFGGLKAVSDLSLSVPAGAITGLIGPNGAGKTTVVNLVTGMLALTGGSVTFAGSDISTAAPEQVARAGIARTFQNIRLLPEQTVLENLLVGFHIHERAGFAASLFGLPAARSERREIENEARRLLAEFEMEAYADYLANALSYGHQRRLEMMRALATKPRLLLLDEPVAGMNDVEADALGRIFRSLADRGMAILLIEHNMRFVMSLCDTVNVLESGALIASGTPSSVAADPRVVEAYLGV